MKTCLYCKIDVGGNLKKCPLCQSKLQGEGEQAYFPKQTTLQIQSLVFKLQSFIVWTAVIVALGLDFLFDLRPFPGFTFHWSLIILMWLLAFEFGIMRLFKKGFSSSRILTLFVFIVIIMLSITAYFFGILPLVLEFLVPIVLIGTMITNFILAMIDKSGNAMIYLLSNVLIGVLPYISLSIMKKDCPFLWIIALLLSVIVFVGAIIFKGREVASEIHRRLNL